MRNDSIKTSLSSRRGDFQENGMQAFWHSIASHCYEKLLLQGVKGKQAPDKSTLLLITFNIFFTALNITIVILLCIACLFLNLSVKIKLFLVKLLYIIKYKNVQIFNYIINFFCLL